MGVALIELFFYLLLFGGLIVGGFLLALGITMFIKPGNNKTAWVYSLLGGIPFVLSGFLLINAPWSGEGTKSHVIKKTQPELSDPATSNDGGGFPSDPEKAELITSDIDLFWNAYDSLMQDSSQNPFHHYIKDGLGVKGFLTNKRIVSAEALKKVVLKERDYYARIRESTYKVSDYESQIRASYRKLKKLYAPAVFPPFYFIVGRTTSGGTATNQGMIIAMEIYSDHSDTTNYGRPSFDLDLLPYMVAHEIIHFLQPEPEGEILLTKCLREGSADFIAELTSGDKVKLLNGDRVYPYGDAHEKQLWKEFEPVMNSTELSPWLYSQTEDGRPQNLGYWMGYQITEAYYQNAEDKQQAIHDIINITDYPKFLKDSGYGEQFK